MRPSSTWSNSSPRKTVVADGPYQQVNHVGITRMAFDVDDTDAVYTKLQKRGDVELLCEPRSVQAPTTGTLRILTFRDPFGIVLELIEHRPQGD